MELTRQEITEMVIEMDNVLDTMRKSGTNTSHAYTMLWRRARRLEESLYRHPY